MCDVILHLVFQLVNNFFKIFRLCWWQYFHWVKHLGYKVSMWKSVNWFLAYDFIFFLFKSFCFWLHLCSLFLALNYFNVFLLCPFTFFQSLLKLDLFLRSWLTFSLITVWTQIFAILNQECAWVNLLLISINFFSLKCWFFLLSFLSLFFFALFGWFLVSFLLFFFLS